MSSFIIKILTFTKCAIQLTMHILECQIIFKNSNINVVIFKVGGGEVMYYESLVKLVNCL